MPAVCLPRAMAIGLVLLLLPLPSAGAALDASEPVRIAALAVAQTASGLVGVAGSVEAQAIGDGSGRVFLDTKPLAQTDMQGSARQSARVAASMLGLDWEAYDYLIVFRSDSPVVGGPSAGAVMTTAIMVALHNLEHPDDPWRADPGVAATGTINPDGTIGPVGGVPAKAEGAAKAGLDHVLYPAGLEEGEVREDGRQRTVSMTEHCEGLDITCSPAATVLDVLEVAAGVRLERPETTVPGTADYGPRLRERVLPEIAELEGRLADTARRLGEAGLGAGDEEAVERDLDAARARLERARSAFDEARYYTAATESFQGAINVGTAGHRIDFYASGRDAAPVEAAIQACIKDAGAARDLTAGLTAEGRTGLYAVGAAQRRAAEAVSLAERAQAEAQAVDRREEWVQALFTASFCSERAETVSWWAGLEEVFGDGPPVVIDALVEATMTETAEFVQYADAVLSGGATDARRLLLEADAHVQEGQGPAALIAAVEAQAAASVAMQSIGRIDSAVVDAARDAASRAIAAARADDVEPVLSVSLVELSMDRDADRIALQDLWTARSLALLSGSAGPPPSATSSPTGWNEAEFGVLLVGFVLGAGGMALVVAVALFATALLPARRR